MLQKKKIPSASLYVTLYRFVKANIIYDAGRGWYSTIANQFSPRYEPIEKISQQMEKQYPHLTFSIWSTEQLQSFAHHLMGRFTAFIYTDMDAIGTITRFLQDRKYMAYPNPRQSEVEKYVTTSEHRVIVRPLVTEGPLDGHYATIEKILIDLFLEKDRLFLMDGAEYNRIFENVIFSHRINMGKLFRYAERRKVKASIIKICQSYKHSIIM